MSATKPCSGWGWCRCERLKRLSYLATRAATLGIEELPARSSFQAAHRRKADRSAAASDARLKLRAAPRNPSARCNLSARPVFHPCSRGLAMLLAGSISAVGDIDAGLMQSQRFALFY